MSHRAVLVVAYAAVCLVWLGIYRLVPCWRSPRRPSFARPWLELGYAAIAIVLVLLLGQAYVHGIRLPDRGGFRPLTESINQAIIFSPVVLLPLVRRQGWISAWLPGNDLLARLGIGLGLSLLALAIHESLEGRTGALPRAMAGVYSFRNAHVAVQVLLEDVAIAVLLVRLSQVLTARRAILGAAFLFALAHLPTLQASGLAPGALLGLVGDFALGALVLSCAWRGADVLWLWPVHTVLDLTQFVHS